MMRLRPIVFLLLFIRSSLALGQTDDSQLNVFGYFQTSFQHWTTLRFETSHPEIIAEERRPEQNSFSLQQLNLFFSKDVAPDWRAFVNFEFLNTYSSSRQWGAFNLEEAWVRYKPSDRFNLKIGLLIPAFNNLNEIKNRTPLLPYIVRPLVYETSFSEFFPGVEEGTPARAFLQASGVLPSGECKFDYAFYLGNSPNISTKPESDQSGIDLTNTFLIGGRVGLRFGEAKVGFSATRENVNLTGEAFQGVPLFTYDKVPRIRFGGDLSFQVERLSFEGEVISITYDDNLPQIDNDKLFYYGTLGFRITEQLFPYVTYWLTQFNYPFVASIPGPIIHTGTGKIEMLGVGAAFQLNDRITFKGQYIRVFLRDEWPLATQSTITSKRRLNIFAAAASVYF